jgi:hypothetical protein
LKMVSWSYWSCKHHPLGWMRATYRRRLMYLDPLDVPSCHSVGWSPAIVQVSRPVDYLLKFQYKECAAWGAAPCHDSRARPLPFPPGGGRGGWGGMLGRDYPPPQSSPTQGEEDAPCRAERWAHEPVKSYIGISE